MMNDQDNPFDKLQLYTSITPDRISGEGRLRFALTLGLNCSDAATKILVNQSLFTFVGNKYQAFFSNDGRVRVFIGNTAYKVKKIGNIRPFASDTERFPNLINSFGKPCFLRSKDAEDELNDDLAITGRKSVFLYDSFDDSSDLEDEATITNIDDYSALVEVERKKLSDEIAIIDKRLEGINNEARESLGRSQELSDATKSKFPSELLDAVSVNEVNFHDLAAILYDHPILLKNYFGMVIQIELTEDVLFQEGQNRINGPLKFGVVDTLGEIYVPDAPNLGNVTTNNLNYKLLSVQEDYHVKKFGEKIYQGRENYGLIKFTDPTKCEWRKKDKITNANSKLVGLENKQKSDGVIRSMINETPLSAEGIILNHKLTKDEFDALFDKEDDPVFGHNIVAKQIDGNEPLIRSLCVRKVNYDFKVNDAPPEFRDDFIEEGHIQIRVTADGQEDGVKTSVSNREIFKWEGHNLCVPQLGGVDDRPSKEALRGEDLNANEDVDPDSNPLEDYGELDNEKLQSTIKEKIVDYEYSLLEGSNMMLAGTGLLKDKMKYSFLIREVEPGSGYMIPIKSDNPKELSIEDLDKTDELNSLWLEFSNNEFDHFKIDTYEDPISAPHIIGKFKYNNTENPNVENDNTILVHEKKKKASRGIFPPDISIQFAQFLGLFLPITMKEEGGNEDGDELTKREYFRRAYRIVKRSKQRIPTWYEKKIKYIADPRGKHLFMVPNNWKTWMRTPETLRRRPLENAFIYKNRKDIYDDTKPFDLQVEWGESFEFERDENSLKIAIPENALLSYRLHLLDDEWLKKLNDGIDNNYDPATIIGLGRRNPSIDFHPNCTAKEPAEPRIKNWDTVPQGEPQRTANRFAYDGNNSLYYYFDFELDKDPVRKSVTLLTQSTQLIDDGTFIPKPTKEIKEKISDGTYLDHDEKEDKKEYPPELFNKVIGNIETQVEDKVVFRNKFGVNFKFPNEVLSYKNINENILTFVINETTRLTLRRVDDNAYRCFLINSELGQDKELFNIELTDDGLVGTIVFDYVPETENLGLIITYTNQQGLRRTEGNLFDFVNTPNPYLSENDISLAPDVEEQIIYNLYPAIISFESFTKSIVGDEFSYELNDTRDEYFVYKESKSKKFFNLDFKLRAVGRHQRWYPGSKIDPFISISTDPYKVSIPNNEKIKPPSIVLTPLFHLYGNPKWKNKEQKKSRAFKLMIEIDRPWSEDQLALIVAHKNSDGVLLDVNEKHSAIGRDITKQGDINPNDLHLDDYLQTDFREIENFELYLSKYLDPVHTSLADNPSDDPTDIWFDNTRHKLFLLNPQFNAKMNKWIAIVGFKDLGDLEDPFIRVIAGRYQRVSNQLEGSTNSGNEDYLKISSLTNPMYIPITSERSVNVAETTENGVDVYQVVVRKNGKKPQLRNSIFVVTFGEKGLRTLQNVPHYVMKGDVINIPRKDSGILTVYEIEKMDNNIDLVNLLLDEEYQNDPSIPLPDGVDPSKKFRNIFEEPTLRVVYMEEFKI